MIKTKELSKSFQHLEVLKSIDLEVKSGEVVAIMGAEQLRKTTLLGVEPAV